MTCPAACPAAVSRPAPQGAASEGCRGDCPVVESPLQHCWKVPACFGRLGLQAEPKGLDPVAVFGVVWAFHCVAGVGAGVLLSNACAAEEGW